jgi:hypothetical protein
VKVLSRVFRGKFIAGLKRAFKQNGKLLFPGSAQAARRKKAFHAFLRPLFRHDWVVYAKRPIRRASNMSSTTWPATRIASPSPTTGS